MLISNKKKRPAGRKYPPGNPKFSDRRAAVFVFLFCLILFFHQHFGHFVDVTCAHGNDHIAFLGVVGYKGGNFFQTVKIVGFFCRLIFFDLGDQSF